MVTPNHKFISLPLKNLNFATVISINVNIWYAGYPICNPQGVVTDRLRTTGLEDSFECLLSYPFIQEGPHYRKLLWMGKYYDQPGSLERCPVTPAGQQSRKPMSLACLPDYFHIACIMASHTQPFKVGQIYEMETSSRLKRPSNLLQMTGLVGNLLYPNLHCCHNQVLEGFICH